MGEWDTLRVSRTDIAGGQGYKQAAGYPDRLFWTARGCARSLFMRSCTRLTLALAALLARARAEPDGAAQCDDAGAPRFGCR